MPKARSACSVCCPRPSLAFGNADTALERVREHTQAMLERERELVLSGLSDTYKGQWGKRFEHEERTVIVKSPYDVPMGPERSMWMNKFSTVRTFGSFLAASRAEEEVAHGRWPFLSSLLFLPYLDSLTHHLSLLSN